MIIKAYNENHNFLLFLDLEFNNQELIQFSGLLFKRVDDEIYQLMRSCNQYINSKVCYNFIEYTNITNSFLAQNGVPLTDFIYFIQEDFLKDIPLNEILVISHGLKNDRLVLENAGLNLSTDELTGHPIDGYCTFTNAKRILKRIKKLTLQDLAEECGYYVYNAHNAYADAWAEVAVFTYIRKIEEQRRQENEND